MRFPTYRDRAPRDRHLDPFHGHARHEDRLAEAARQESYGDYEEVSRRTRTYLRNMIVSGLTFVALIALVVVFVSYAMVR